jgi:hypothetical protein
MRDPYVDPPRQRRDDERRGSLEQPQTECGMVQDATKLRSRAEATQRRGHDIWSHRSLLDLSGLDGAEQPTWRERGRPQDIAQAQLPVDHARTLTRAACLLDVAAGTR